MLIKEVNGQTGHYTGLGAYGANAFVIKKQLSESLKTNDVIRDKAAKVRYTPKFKKEFGIAQVQDALGWASADLSAQSKENMAAFEIELKNYKTRINTVTETRGLGLLSAFFLFPSIKMVEKYIFNRRGFLEGLQNLTSLAETLRDTEGLQNSMRNILDTDNSGSLDISELVAWQIFKDDPATMMQQQIEKRATEWQSQSIFNNLTRFYGHYRSKLDGIITQGDEALASISMLDLHHYVVDCLKEISEKYQLREEAKNFSFPTKNG